jgi:hypothetical protein
MPTTRREVRWALMFPDELEGEYPAPQRDSVCYENWRLPKVRG